MYFSILKPIQNYERTKYDMHKKCDFFFLIIIKHMNVLLYYKYHIQFLLNKLHFLKYLRRTFKIK